MTSELLDRESFTARLREVGVRAYHDKHPFHVAMNEGRLSPGRVPRLGGESFLLSTQHPNKRRRDSFELSAARGAPECGFIGSLDHDGSSENGRRNRSMAAAWRSVRIVARTNCWRIGICSRESALPSMPT